MTERSLFLSHVYSATIHEAGTPTHTRWYTQPLLRTVPSIEDGTDDQLQSACSLHTTEKKYHRCHYYKITGYAAG